MNILQRWTVILGVLAPTFAVAAPSALVVVDAWIPQAPPGAGMLAGYATLRNDGAQPVRVTGATSTAFADVSIHETTLVDGVSRMRALDVIEIAPGADVRLEPGGRHLMLMKPTGDADPGARIDVVFALDDGSAVPAVFVVRGADTNTAPATDHAHHGH